MEEIVAGPPGFEPGTSNFEGWRPIQTRLRALGRSIEVSLLRTSVSQRVNRLELILLETYLVANSYYFEEDRLDCDSIIDMSSSQVPSFLNNL